MHFLTSRRFRLVCSSEEFDHRRELEKKRFLTRQRRVVLSPNPISFDKGGFFDFDKDDFFCHANRPAAVDFNPTSDLPN